LVGVDMFFTYWISNTTDNSKYRLQDYQTVKDTAIEQLHYLDESERCFAKERTNKQANKQPTPF